MFVKRDYSEYLILRFVVLFFLVLSFLFSSLLVYEIADIISPLIFLSLLYTSIYFCEIVFIIEDKELFFLSEKIFFFFVITTISSIFLICYILFIRPMFRNSYIWALEKICNIFFLNCLLLAFYIFMYFGLFYLNKLNALKEKIKDYVILNITVEGFGLYLYDFKSIYYLYIVLVVFSIFFFIDKSFVIYATRVFLFSLLIILISLYLYKFSVIVENFRCIYIYIFFLEIFLFLRNLADFDFFKCKY